MQPSYSRLVIKKKYDGQNPKAKDNTFLQQHGSMNKASASSPDQAAAQFFRDQDVYFKIKGSNRMLTWRIKIVGTVVAQCLFG